MISSSPRTLPQFRSGIVHFLAISCVARYRAFRSAVSLGNTLSLLIQTAIAAVKALNGVGGVNDLPDVGGELKNWRYYVPVLVPTLHSIGIIVFPFFCDTVEGFQSSVLGRRMIYRFQVVCELLLVFLSDVFQRIASFMPVRPSAQMARTSLTPRFFCSFRTPSQYLALSFSPICIERTSL